MAAFDYSNLAATATALLTKFGTPGCRVIRAASSGLDPNAPWKGADGADQVVIASCVILQGGMSRLKVGAPHSYRGTGQVPQDYDEGTYFMTGADGASVVKGDLVEFPAGDRLAVKEITPLRPGGVNLMWQLELEGS